ncbi:MAG: hypothetical protein LAQ69_30810 [Acidobacteriia bacterium]|nr:hypothetical protein [Terriglobia bacterium]
MFIIAGPPGGGKSSFFALSGLADHVFNADDRAAELNAGSYENIPTAVRAAVNREFEEFVHGNIRTGTSFANEPCGLMIKRDMARQLFPSSFACDCGNQSHFCENTVHEMEAYTSRRRKPGHLLDAESEEHAIVFENGRATAVICPKLGRCIITRRR